jgi:hypothetical protein
MSDCIEEAEGLDADLIECLSAAGSDCAAVEVCFGPMMLREYEAESQCEQRCGGGAEAECCGDDLLAICDTEEGVPWRIEDCGHFGWTCTPGSPARCTDGSERTCSEGTPRRCDGDQLVFCVSGYEIAFDCGRVIDGFGCYQVDSDDPDCGYGEGCDPDSNGTCDGDILTFCAGGELRSVDCAEMGFSECDESFHRGSCRPGSEADGDADADADADAGLCQDVGAPCGPGAPCPQGARCLVVDSAGICVPEGEGRDSCRGPIIISPCPEGMSCLTDLEYYDAVCVTDEERAEICACDDSSLLEC